MLGDARDAEVLERYFEERLASTPVELVIGPAQARVTAHFAPAHAAARNAVLEALDSHAVTWGYSTTSTGCSTEPLRTAAATAPAAEILPQAVAHAYRRAKHRMHQARRAPEGATRDVALHEARKAAKRARYAAEAVEPVFGKKARRFAKRMKAVQSVLGDHQDAVTARGVAREIGVQAHLARGERVQLRPAERARAPRRAGVPAAGQVGLEAGRPAQGAPWLRPGRAKLAGTAQRTLSGNFVLFERIGEGCLGSGLRCSDKTAQLLASLKDAR